MSKMRILIADDEEGIRESLNLILSDEYELVFAKDGQETLAKLGQEPVELVLLDIKMPKLDGLDVLRQLKGRGISTPVIANVGDRINPRTPSFRSCIASSSQFHPQASRDCSMNRCVSPNLAGSCIDARWSRISSTSSRS